MFFGTSAAYCAKSHPGISQLSIPVTVHFLDDVFSTLTSEPAKPSFAPLSTKEP